MNRAGGLGVELVERAQAFGRDVHVPLAQQPDVARDRHHPKIDGVGDAARGLGRDGDGVAHLHLQLLELPLEQEDGVGLGEVLDVARDDLQDVLEGRLLANVYAVDAGLHRAEIRDDLGPPAPALDREVQLRDRLPGDLQHLSPFGDHRGRLAGVDLEESAHVQVTGAERGGGMGHGLADARRQPVQQDEERGHGGDGGAEEHRALAVLEQAAKRDLKVGAEP